MVKVVKLRLASDRSERLSILDTDLQVLQVKKTVDLLEMQVQQLELQIRRFVLKRKLFFLVNRLVLIGKAISVKLAAISHKNTNQRAQAMFCLKRKKLLEQVLEKRLSPLENLHKIVLTFQSAESDAGVSI